jgi:hypothetical protein
MDIRISDQILNQFLDELRSQWAQNSGLRLQEERRLKLENDRLEFELEDDRRKRRETMAKETSP